MTESPSCIRCVCLVVEHEDQLLLVQAHHRNKYYFPGGKIDDGESQIQALQREIKEELNVKLNEDEIEFLGQVVGPAYPQKDQFTELNCYRTTGQYDWDQIAPKHEITDIKWIDKNETSLIAPAVIQWIEQRRTQQVSIQFVPYDHTLYDTVEDIEVASSDRKFTKTPMDNIELAKTDDERYPTLIYNAQQQCVGFFTLHRGEGVAPYTDNPHAIFFRSFSIDVNERGHGYAKATIKQLPQYIHGHFSDINEVYLTVNDDNERAQQLYEQCDYQYVGESTAEGRPVYIMKREI